MQPTTLHRMWKKQFLYLLSDSLKMKPLFFVSVAIAVCHSLYTEYDRDRIDTAPKLAPTSDGEFINSGTPGGVPLSFDCSARYYAWEYGKQIQPRHGNFVELFDALQLQACNYSRPSPHKRHSPIYTTDIDADCSYFVDADSGSDSNDGSLSSPFQSIMKAVDATRSNKEESSSSCTINLMEGTYHQKETIVLTEKDTYLTFQNYNGQRVSISGGIPVQFEGDWTLENYKDTEWVTYEGWNNVIGISSQSDNNDKTKFRNQIDQIP